MRLLKHLQTRSWLVLDDSGQSMVESALVLGLFITMLVGMMDFGRVLWIHETLTAAARSGARYAMMHGARNPLGEGDPSVESVVEKAAPGLNADDLSADDLSVTVTWTPDNKPGSVVSVEAQYPVGLIAGPLISASGYFTLESVSTRSGLN